MKNKKGFTLIELLAVVVILAIIALVSTPIILDIIENAQKGALKNTAYGIIEAGKFNYTSDILKLGDANFTAFTYTNGVETSIPSGKSLEYKGEKPKSGQILVNSKGEMSIAIYNGKYCAEKTYEAVEVTINQKTEDQCQLIEQLTEIEVLVVAGGGGGSGSIAGGGGAGGLIYNSTYGVTPGQSIEVVVGNGGAGGATQQPGNNGQDSTFGSLVAIGGGRGASGGNTGNIPAGAGGSGGGGQKYSSTPINPTGGASTSGQGNNGGNVTFARGYAGGGGAGGPGNDAPADNLSGNGGIGLYFGDKFGDSLGDQGWFAGGGGGSSSSASNISQGGKGGGASGGYTADAGNAIPNTGGGGGGCYAYATGRGGNGGSGIVIVRYYGTQRANGGAVTTVGEYTVHTFSSGIATFDVAQF